MLKTTHSGYLLHTAAGQRGTVPLPTQAMQSAQDHHEGYRLAKEAVKPLLALTA